MLSDDEIKALALKHSSDNVAFARAIIAAYQDKLRQGVELPEPWCASYDTVESRGGAFLFYSEDQLIAIRDASIQAGYLRGLGDAKRVCEELPASGEFKRYEQGVYDIATLDCAAAIDKLKGGE